MDGQWRAHTASLPIASASASRPLRGRRVLRSRWSRQRGNDGKARVLLPSDVEVEPAPARRRDSASDAHAATIAAPESHISTLREELATERERSEAQLAAARADLAAEQARAVRAIAAFEGLAQRLEAMAAARAPVLAATGSASPAKALSRARCPADSS